MPVALSEPVLVTGATGFIGRRVVARLLAAGARTRAFVLPAERVPESWSERVEVVRGDVGDRASVDQAVRGAGTVIHLAAMVGDWGGEELHRRVTVEGTEHVLRATAAEGARAVLASSVVVYGDRIPKDVCPEEHPFGTPLGPYGRSKQAQERTARRLERERGLRVAILRPGNVFGAGSGPWVDVAVGELRKGMPTLLDGGRGNAALCHVDNVAEAFVLAAGAEAAVGRAYNVNDDNGITWRRYFEDLARLAGTRPPRSIPRLAVDLLARASEAAWAVLRRTDRPLVTREAVNLVGSHFRVPVARIRRELGFEPGTSYERGMEEVAAYLASRP
ncbi:MAG: NAD-dependent epimerase/dehydratase family protein [Myxococcales bacterium]|nr:NAD-dependent epimerase/dehydratase family protein [Myxococcales bacterium]